MLMGGGIGVRPCGYALKVIGKYVNDNWPGSFEVFGESKNSEKLAVFYNGIGTIKNAEFIFYEIALKFGVNNRYKFGRVYYTSNIETTAGCVFISTVDGKKYELVFKNRINSNDIIVECSKIEGSKDHWFIKNEDYVWLYSFGN